MMPGGSYAPTIGRIPSAAHKTSAIGARTVRLDLRAKNRIGILARFLDSQEYE